MPKGQARLSFEQDCFVSLFYITDTGRDILQGMLSVYQDEYLTSLWGRQQQRGYNPGKIALCMSSWAFSFFFSGHFHFILQCATYISFQIFFFESFHWPWRQHDGSRQASLRAFDLTAEVQEQGRHTGMADCQPESCLGNSSRYLLSNL